MKILGCESNMQTENLNNFITWLLAGIRNGTYANGSKWRNLKYVYLWKL